MPLYRAPATGGAVWGAPDYSGAGTSKWFVLRYHDASVTTYSTQEDLLFAPFDVGGACSVEAIACEVDTSDASATIRLGIYSGDYEPTTLISDAGTVSAASTGVKSLTGLAIALTGGRYWVAAVIQGGAAVIKSINQTITDSSFASWLDGIDFAYNPPRSGYKDPGVSGALPSSPTLGSTGANFHSPMVAVRFA